MRKELVLFTHSYPFGKAETFLETEIPYLCKVFEEVTIVSATRAASERRAVPENCEVTTLHQPFTTSLKLRSLRGLFSAIFNNEKKVIKQDYNLPISKGRIMTALISLERAKKIENYILNAYKNRFDQALFYSYWCDDAALGIALAHKHNHNVIGVSRVHGWDVYFERSEVNYLPYRKLITENLAEIYSISLNGIEYATHRWKIDRSKFKLSRLGIRNKLGYVQPKGDTFKVVSCSSIIPLKRVELIAEVLSGITDYAIEWTHIGDGILMEELQSKVKSLPENISVNLVGNMPNQSVFKLYNELSPDLFINVSEYEGIPVSIMEAMSFGIPVLATNVGGTGEIVDDGNGRLFDAEGALVEEITDYILKILNGEIDLAKLKEGAFNTWKEKYDAAKNYPAFAEELVRL